uniref:Ig-like domain-containing protein n=1 Tax=Haplochromis burtoni TaxID=8153 RepID=A0A3Q2WWA6_HAPBU
MHTGDYTCLAQNTYLNTSSNNTISLTVYYPPDGSPSCSVEPALNHTSLRLLCSWPGGFPSPSLHWTGDLIQDQFNTPQQTSSASNTTILISTAISLPSGGPTSNNSLFTCVGSHPALKQSTQCSTRTYIPPAEPLCFAYVTNDKQYLTMSCSWEGGAPKALVWWEGPEGQSKGGEETSNNFTLRYSTVRFGRPYSCHARHPLLVQTKTCRLTLVPVNKPYILMSDTSPVEGSSMWMRCNVENGTEPIRYVWQRETSSEDVTTFAQGNNSIINVTNVNRNHTGWYLCVASNNINSQTSDRVWLDTIFGPDVPQIDVTPPRTVKQGYTALETEAVSLLCQAQSNPASQYVWFYNNSQVYTGQKFTITKILRVDAGDYTCLAQNTYLNTRTKKTISMTVYYPPDGSPSCSVEPALNHTSLRLLCSWPGGFPSPSLHWTGDLIQDQSNIAQLTSSASSTTIMLPSGGLTSNNSLFTCLGSHPALKQSTQCSTRTC